MKTSQWFRSIGRGSGLTLALVCALALWAAPAQSAGGDEPSFPPPVSPYNPHIDPADFVAGVDHPYFPLEPGTTFTYEGTGADEGEDVTVYVTHKTKKIMGITTIEVSDIVSEDSEVIESTLDWYAQDRWDNVWYFGENTKEYEDGKVVSTFGSWMAGRDGAKPGIIMLGEPEVGDTYRQEYRKGVAEDMAQVVDLDAEADVPYGSFDDVWVTKEWTPLDPKARENKYYAPGVGFVLEETTKGPKAGSELVDVQHD
jgi:hypothetical protein